MYRSPYKIACYYFDRLSSPQYLEQKLMKVLIKRLGRLAVFPSRWNGTDLELTIRLEPGPSSD